MYCEKLLTVGNCVFFSIWQLCIFYYKLPALICPFVLTADIDNPVMMVTKLETIITNDPSAEKLK